MGLVASGVDAMAQIGISIFSKTTGPGSSLTLECPIEDDQLALVGGGAVGSENPGGFLTASHPNKDKTGWAASSHDHINPDNHTLTVFAIGMAVSGMTKDELANNLFIDKASSVVSPHPSASMKAPNTSSFPFRNYTVIGGGFQVEPSSGNFATASYPEDDQRWTARSKDHLAPSPAKITSWVIGIKPKLHRVGNPPIFLDIRPVAALSGEDRHSSVTAELPEGYVLVGAGAEVRCDGAGQLIWRLEPGRVQMGSSKPFFTVTASAKDHYTPSPGVINAWAIGIRALNDAEIQDITA